MICSLLKIDVVSFPGFGCVWQGYDFATKFYIKMAIPLVVSALLMMPVPVVWCISQMYLKKRSESESTSSTHPHNKSSTEHLISPQSSQVFKSAVSLRQPVISSFMYKKGSWKYSRFQRQYFVLRQEWSGPSLNYFHSEAESEDKLLSNGSLTFEAMSLEPDIGVMKHGDKKLYCLALSTVAGTSMRRLVCGCETEDERKTWTDALSDAIANAEIMRSAALEDPATKWTQRYHATVKYVAKKCTEIERKRDIVTRNEKKMYLLLYLNVSICICMASKSSH